MRFGCCVGYEHLDVLARNGYDYIELEGKSTLHPGVDEETFKRIKSAVDGSPLGAECFNRFSSGDLKVVGPDVDWALVEHYVDVSLRRAAELGGTIVGFGSGASRTYPLGFPREKAWDQLVHFMDIMGRYAAKYGLIVAIEALNRNQTNLVNSTEEAVALAQAVNRPEVRVTLDFYHMMLEGEGPEVVPLVADLLAHVHVANRRRGYPHENLEEFTAFFRALRDIGYEGRVSIEAEYEDLNMESRRSLDFLKQALILSET